MSPFGPAYGVTGAAAGGAEDEGAVDFASVGDFAAGAAVGADVDGEVGDEEGAFAMGAAAAPSLDSSMRISEPWETLSPVLMRTSFTTPDCGAGTSVVALSDSSVISGSSFFTLSPGFTST